MPSLDHHNQPDRPPGQTPEPIGPFPASPEARGEHDGIDRRRWMQLMGASMALAAAGGCRWEMQEIHPFATRPEYQVPGRTRRFATAMPRGESALGLMVTSVDGRPIKVEGNPLHPQSLGATDGAAQAAILDMYDPDRIRSARVGRDSRDVWGDFSEAIGPLAAPLIAAGGAGLGILAELSSSPTLTRLRGELLAALPKMRWDDYEPLGDDNERAGATLAFGRPLRTHVALDKARVIVCLDADPLGAHPAAVRHAHDFAAGRNPDAEWMSRLYVVEGGFSITGAAADHRLPLRPSRIPALVAILEKRLADQADSEGERVARPVESAGSAERFLDAVVHDLLDPNHLGRSVVCVGPGQPPEVHAAVHHINERLGNVGPAKPVHYTQTAHPERPKMVEAIARLVEQIRVGGVDVLVILGGNPVYDAPADLAFAKHLDAVDTTIYLGPYRNETSRQCTWHLPEAHFIESWGDVRAFDGTYSVVQPMIAPLGQGRPAIELLATMLQMSRGVSRPEVSAEAQVRRTFLQVAGTDDETAWRRTLRDGLLADSQWPVETVGEPTAVDLAIESSNVDALYAALRETDVIEPVEIVFRRDVKVGDGRWANNAWLQELPEPITKLTWGNAALMGPATAERLGVADQTVVALGVGEKRVEMPASIVPGIAPGCVVVSLGYGRTAAGQVGGDPDTGAESVGVDVYPLRTAATMDFAPGATVEATGRPWSLASTQDHYAIDAVGRKARDRRAGVLLRQAAIEDYRAEPGVVHHAGHHPPLKSLWQDHEYTGHRWGMAIDLSKCIGCGACVMACQAENNIPIVGRQEVLRGREMHWIRIDRYFQGEPDNPRVGHQPVPCQQCELAPCEQVCPVAATVHSGEGLNDMVYNRCVGTRYCANNCPFKVRRFNYFNFHKDLGGRNEAAKMKYNPQVTVRSRGVMEKCTYCVQRISAAKIEEKLSGQPILDGQIRTACQQVCPTGAIIFGDLADPESEVARHQASARAYAMLAELNIRPRTQYLARISNPNPALAGGGSAEKHNGEA